MGRLVLETRPLRAHQIRKAFERSAFWHELIYLDQVGSTNDLAKDLASEGARAGTVVVAEEQTAGRGRLGRRWSAPAQTSLLCSMLFRPEIEPRAVHQLTMLCSMAAVDAIEGLADLSVALKWPNDLVVPTPTVGTQSPAWRKLAGVLTETGLTQGELGFVVVGIGINVNVPHDDLASLAPRATSILAETGRVVDRSALLIELLDAAEQRYERREGGENPQREWATKLSSLGRHVEVTTSEGKLEGIAEGVDEEGALLLRTRQGALRRVLVGDVRLGRL